MSPWRLAVLNLLRHKRGAVTVVICLALALAAGATVLGVADRGVGFAEGVTGHHDAVIGPKSEGLSLVVEALELRAPSEDVVPYGMFPRIERRFSPAHLVSLHVFAGYQGAAVIGVEDAWLLRDEGAPKLSEGRWFEGRGQVVVGKAAAARLGLSLGQRLDLRASPSTQMVARALVRRPDLNPQARFDPAPEPFADPGERALWKASVEVVGILDHGGSPFDEALFVHRDHAADFHQAGYREDIARKVSQRGATTYVLVRLREASQLEDLRRYIQDGSTLQFAAVGAELDRLRGLTRQGRFAAASVALVVVLLVVLSIGVLLNARFDALLPRLGLLVALGYRRRAVGLTLLFEGLLLAAGAVILGLALYALWVGPLDLPTRLGLPPETTGWSRQALLVWAVAPLGVLPAVALPLLRLARVNLRETLQGL